MRVATRSKKNRGNAQANKYRATKGCRGGCCQNIKNIIVKKECFVQTASVLRWKHHALSGVWARSRFFLHVHPV